MSRPSAAPDYNVMSDEDFRREIRAFFEAEYPPHLRYILHRARWRDMKDWWRKLDAKAGSRPTGRASGAAWRSTPARW